MAEKRTKNKARRDNLLTLIASVLVAIAAWLVLSLTAFSDLSVTLRDVPIDFSLEGTYADLLGLSVVDNDISAVNVSFVGQRDSVGNYTADDIKVTLDLNNVRTSGTYDIPLVVTSVNGDQLDNIEIGPQRTVHIEFDRYDKRTLSVADGTLTLDLSNISAAPGYVIDEEEVEITPSEIVISGPQDYIDQVTSCVISFDSGRTLSESANISTPSFKLYSNNAVFENPKVSAEEDSFGVYIPVYLTKRLPLDITITTYSDNVDVSSIPYTLSEDSILVRSQNAGIDRIDNIGLGYVDVRNIRPGTVQTFWIPLNSYYENISGIDKVSVNFDLEGYAEKNLTLTNSQIFAINGSSDYKVTVETNRISVTVVGPEEVLDAIDPLNFVAEIDLIDYNLEDLAAGQERLMNLSIYAPGYSNVWAIGSYQAFVRITPAEQTDAQTEE